MAHMGLVAEWVEPLMLAARLKSYTTKAATRIDVHHKPQDQRDDKHKIDGMVLVHFDVSEEALKHESTDPVDVIRGPIHFSVGANIGATTLVEQLGELEIKMLSSLTKDQWGKVTCYDDVSGDQLEAELYQAARDLEADYPKRTCTQI